MNAAAARHVRLSSLLPALVGLLPVARFLAVLLYLDSYKLVRLNAVVAIVACGAVVAGGRAISANAPCNRNFWTSTSTRFSRYVSPSSRSC